VAKVEMRSQGSVVGRSNGCPAGVDGGASWRQQIPENQTTDFLATPTLLTAWAVLGLRKVWYAY
jgi:hypothetical protein